MTCHGANGEGQAAAGFPRLAGQPAGYLRKQLDDFASGARKNATMEPFARALSDAQKQDSADYYASLPGWKPPKGAAGGQADAGGKISASGKEQAGANPNASAKTAPATDSTSASAGGQSNTAPPTTPNDTGYTLATRGNWPKGVPACYACHGDGGDGIPPHFPALAGQPASYIKSQLNAWKTGTRNNDPQGLMKSVAMRLNESEVNAVSAFFERPVQKERGNK